MAIVTLLSDFGSRTPYPAQMRAAVLRRCSASLVDVTHDVARHDVREGAYLLRAVVRACPPGTAHLAVVDPGVGTARRGLAVAAGGQLLVGPDNGLLMPAALRLGDPRIHSIAASDLIEPEPSATFHGRDVFAPIAAHLACGGGLARVGPPISDPVPLDFGEGRRDGDRLVGEVIYADAFGNLITNIPAELLRGTLRLRLGSHDLAVAATYAEVPPGALVAVPGSDGGVEIAVREGSAAVELGIAPGAAIVLALR